MDLNVRAFRTVQAALAEPGKPAKPPESELRDAVSC
jgi:hypothetical protein